MFCWISTFQLKKYRIIIVSKILERGVNKQLVKYIEGNNLLSDNQFGLLCQAFNWTELAARLFADQIQKAADNKLMIDGAVILDVLRSWPPTRKVEVVRHKKTYLFQRSQIVKLGQSVSPMPKLTKQIWKILEENSMLSFIWRIVMIIIIYVVN